MKKLKHIDTTVSYLVLKAGAKIRIWGMHMRKRVGLCNLNHGHGAVT